MATAVAAVCLLLCEGRARQGHHGGQRLPRVSPRAGVVARSLSAGERRALDREVLRIAAPALAGLCIEPLAAVVDTAWAGRLGAVDLAALGATNAVVGLVFKSFNFLLSATTSAVASAAPCDDADVDTASNALCAVGDGLPPSAAAAAASAVAVAVVIGVPLTIALWLGAPSLLALTNVGSASPVRAPAVACLRARALAAPAALVSLALTGTFRGARDTTTPLRAVSVASVTNMVLDCIAVRLLPVGRAVVGIAAATSVAQIVGVVVLARGLARRVADVHQWRPSKQQATALAGSASVLTARTFAGLLTFTAASSAALAISPAVGAAHAVVFQTWLQTTLLADALAVACQSLLAAALAPSRSGSGVRAPVAIAGCALRLGLLLTAIVTAAAVLGGPAIVHCLAPAGPAALTARAVWPWAVATQPLTVAAFLLDGLLFGARDYAGATSAVIAGAIPAVCMLARVGRQGPALAASAAALDGVWRALAVYMGVRSFVAFVRVLSSPWARLGKAASS